MCMFTTSYALLFRIALYSILALQCVMCTGKLAIYTCTPSLYALPYGLCILLVKGILTDFR